MLSYVMLAAPFAHGAPVPAADQARYQTGRARTADMAGSGQAHFPDPPSALQPAPPAVAAPGVSATKTDFWDDAATPDGRVEPGQVITYTVTITNSGPDPAVGVTFTDTVNPATGSLVAGSVNTQPVTGPDSYAASGNIPISPAAPGVLANDRDPDTGDNSGLTVTKVQGSAANVGVAADTAQAGRGSVKGSVTLNANGSFTYEPPPGFTGSDTFTYEASDGTSADTQTVTVNITGTAWFIQNNAAGSLNRGTFSHPFTTIAAFNAANAGAGAAPDPKGGDTVALRAGSGTYAEADGINLRAQQKVIGEGVAFNSSFTAAPDSSSAYTAFAGAAGSAPSIVTTAGNGIDLAADNAVRGFNVGNTPGFFKLSGGAVGSPTVSGVNLTGTGGAINVSTSGSFGSNVSFGTLESAGSPGANINLVGVTGALSIGSGGAGLAGSASSSAAVSVSGGSVSFTYAGNVTKSNAGALVAVGGGHSGTITFNTGTLSATSGTGLQFDNADGAYNFDGATTLNGGDAGLDITNGSSGQFNFSAQASITSPTGTAFNVAAGPGAPLVTYDGVVTQNTAGQRAVNIDGTVGGSIGINSVAAGTTAGGVGNTGVNVNNVNGSVSFTTLALGTASARMTQQAVTISSGSGTYSLGAVSIFTSGAQGIVAGNADGALNTTSGTVDASGAAAMTIDGPAGLTTLGMTLSKVSSSGSSRGISIQDTNGSFTITGSGGTCTGADQSGCSGGVIANMAGGDDSSASPVGAGIVLNNVTGVSLTRVWIHDHSNYGIRGTNVAGFNLTNSLINGTNGTNAATDDSSVYFTQLTGSALIADSEIDGGFEDNFKLVNTGGALNRITFTGDIIGNTSNTSGDALILDANGGSLNVTIQNSQFKRAAGDLFQLNIHGTAVSDLIFTGNALSNNHPAISGGGGGTTITASGSGDLTYNISNNTFRGAKGSALLVNKPFGGLPGDGTMSGTIEGNVIGTAGAVKNGSSEASGISLGLLAQGSHTSLVKNNQIYDYEQMGISMNIGGTSSSVTGLTHNGTVNFTFHGNTVAEPLASAGAFAQNGIHLNGGTNSTGGNDAYQICVDIGDPAVVAERNTLTASGALGGEDIRIRQRFSTTVFLPGYGGANNDDTAVENYLLGRNTAGSASATNTVSTGGGGFKNTSPAGSSCAQPPAPTMPEVFDSRLRGDGEGAAQTAAVSAPTLSAASAAVSSLLFVSRQHAKTPAQAATLADAVRAGAAQARSQPSAAQPAAVQQTEAGSDAVTAYASGKTRHVDVATLDPGVAKGAGGSLNLNIGTLGPNGDSVTITFQVAVDNPFPSNLTKVVNQGTVSGTNFSNVPTDDPSVAGSSDPTETPVNTVNVNVNDAEEAEPASGERRMLFVVALSAPPSSAVSINFSISDGTATGGASCDGVADYVTVTPGMVNIPAGAQTGVAEVTVCADNAGGESDETFQLSISDPSSGTIQDGAATGTITQASAAGALLISELRTFGPGGSNDPADEFVELYNNSDSPHTVQATDASAGYGVYAAGAGCDASPVLLGVVPNGTVIPARGHYLLVGSAYSLSNYGGTGAASGDLTMSSDVPSNGNAGVFSTAELANLSSVNRLDAVGFGSNAGATCSLLSEGATAPAAATNINTLGQYSYFRRQCDFVAGVGCSTPGYPKDTNENASDFLFADPAGMDAGAGQRLGAAGPENMASPVRRDTSGLNVFTLDLTQPSQNPPNRVRDFTSDPANNATHGTLSVRRKVTNNTGQPVTRLRFRVVELTTFPSPGGGQADLRALSSSSVTVAGISDAGTCASTGTPSTAPCQVTVAGTALEQPPSQPEGGGYNSTLTLQLGAPLNNGQSVNVQFLLGIETTGKFRFYIVAEALP